jgi:Caspase domain
MNLSLRHSTALKTMPPHRGCLLVVVCIILLKLIITPSAMAFSKVALVIGNTNYPDPAKLTNPVHDATAVKEVLEAFHFNVLFKLDCNREQIENLIEQFAGYCKTADVALFYYSGHGVQVNQSNFLVPIEVSSFTTEASIPYHAIDADQILDVLNESGAALKLMILDACRDNPFQRSLRSLRRGLASMSTSIGRTNILFSTSPGSTASDDPTEPNSRFTGTLVKYLANQRLKLWEVVTDTIEDVTKANPQQIPWLLTSGGLQFALSDSFANRDETIGLYYEGLPSSLLSTLRKARANGEHIRSVGLAGTSYVLCTDQQIYYNNIPADLEKAILNYSQDAQRTPQNSVSRVFLGPNGRWLIATVGNEFTVSDGMPRLDSTLKDLKRSGQGINWAAFSEQGWCLSGASFGYKYLAVPASFSDALTSIYSSQTEIGCFAFSPAYGWIVIEGENQFHDSPGIPVNMERALQRIQGAGQKVALLTLNTDNGWLVIREP